MLDKGLVGQKQVALNMIYDGIELAYQNTFSSQCLAAAEIGPAKLLHLS